GASPVVVFHLFLPAHGTRWRQSANLLIQQIRFSEGTPLILDAAGLDGVLGNVADLAFDTASPGDNFPHRRSVDAVLRGSGLNGLFRVAIAAGEVGPKCVRDCVDIRHGKSSLLGYLACLSF